MVLAVALSALQAVAAAQATDFPARAAAELANLHEGITLTAWMGTHPTDTTVLYSHRHWDWGNWIVRVDKAERLTDGREITRRAYFYAPDPPADMSLPRRESSQEILVSAQLGFVWIDVNEPDATAGAELAERTREELSKRFASGRFELKLWFANAGSWSRTAKWNVGPATFASAYESIAGTPRPPRVLAFGFLPVSGLHLDLAGGEDVYGAAFESQRHWLDKIIAASGFAGKDLEPILRVKQRIDEYHSGGSEQWKTAVNDEVIAELKQWLSASRRRGRRQQAAALLAADVAYDLSEQFVNPDDQITRRRLKSLGANFIYAQLDGWVYTHDWLKKARRLDRRGPIGDVSLITMMEKGFDISGMCGDTGYEGFRRVIFAGERFLLRSRNRDLRLRVQLLVAEAYSDIVALADGAGEGYVDAAKYQRAAPWARSMAIWHYRRLLRSPDRTAEQMKRWKATWRLLAGAPPIGTNFFCVYD